MPRMVLYRGGPGRKSKGVRRTFATRIVKPYSDEIERRADALGMSLSDYIADIVINHIETTEAPPGAQEAQLAIAEGEPLNRTA